MPFCQSCGTELSGDANFCPSCGSSTSTNTEYSKGYTNQGYTNQMFLAPDKEPREVNQSYLIASFLFLFALALAFFAFQSSWYSVTMQITEIDGTESDIRFSSEDYLEKRDDKFSYDFMDETDSSSEVLNNDELQLEFSETAKTKKTMVNLYYVVLGTIAILTMACFINSFSRTDSGGALSIFGIFAFAVVVSTVVFFTVFFNPMDDGVTSTEDDPTLIINEETSSGTFWSLEGTMDGEMDGSNFKARVFGGVNNGYLFSLAAALLLFIGTFFVAYESYDSY
jgi:amino acid transporter